MNQNNLYNEQYTPFMDNDPPKRKRRFPVFLLFFILIGCGVGVYFFYFYKVSAKQVINKAFDTLFSQAPTFEKVLDKISDFDIKNDTLKGSFNLKLNFEGNVDGQKIDFKNIDLNYQMATNIKNQELLFKASTSQNNKEIINANVFIKNDKAYFTSNIFDNTYFVSDDFQSYWKEINDATDKIPHYNTNDLKKLIEKNKVFLKNTIKDEYLIQESGSYKIDETTISGIKTTLELTNERLNEMEINYYNDALADDEYLETLARFMKITKEELRDSYNKQITNLKNQKNMISSTDKVYFNIYTKRNGQFLALDIVSNSEVSLTAVLNDNIISFKNI